MRKFVFTFSIIFSLIVSCKVKQNTNSAATVQESKTIGKVSHQYRVSGCSTVIIVKINAEAEPLILIPSEELSEKYDVDGIVILFDYHPLKMLQPPGCNVGIPAEITNISKK